MVTEFQPTVNPEQLLHLSIRLGAPKKLQVMFSCLQHVDGQGELKLPVTKTAAELHCSREYVSRVLSELVNQGVLTDLAPVAHPGRGGHRFRLTDGLVAPSDYPSYTFLTSLFLTENFAQEQAIKKIRLETLSHCKHIFVQLASHLGKHWLWPFGPTSTG